jgi:hypothetical protein
MPTSARGRPRPTRSRGTTTPEDILAEHTPQVRDVAERLRALIRMTVPEAMEVAYPGWHGIGYHHPETGYVFAIFPEADRVRLGFEHGVDLPDPQGLLTGSGKRVRYVEIPAGKRPTVRAIRQLLLAAVHRPR